jgi:hypothetical protein
VVPWRVAKCLTTLGGQWKAAHPGAANPGFIGDAAHASRDSDHNPWVDDPASPLNVVTAGDFYHQPSIGADAGKLAEALKLHKDPRVKYVIWSRRIWSLARDAEGWRPYAGDNPHTHHVHVSCSYVKTRYDDTRPWNLSLAAAGGPTGTPPKETDVTPGQQAQLDRIEKGVNILLGESRAHDAEEDSRYRREEKWNQEILAAAKDDHEGTVPSVNG